MEYYNYLTTPSGKLCNLNELKNKDYLILQKFLNGENYEGFYKKLDDLISVSIPDFNEYDICDKAYIYIAYYFYSVKTTIPLNSTQYNNIEVPISNILESIEENYINKIIEINLFNDYNCHISYPTNLSLYNNNIAIDYSTCIKKINNEILSKEEKEKIYPLLPVKVVNHVEVMAKKYFNNKIIITTKIGDIEEIEEELLSPSLFYVICQIYKESLESFYNMLYLICHYIKIDWKSIMDLTPIEMLIIYNNFIKDKEKQNRDMQERQNKNVLNTSLLSEQMDNFI